MNGYKFETASNIVELNTGLQGVIKKIEKEVLKNNISYNQLKYVFRIVRKKCKLEQDKQRKKLYELPTQDEICRFYEGMKNPVYKLLFETLQGTGIRVGELVAIEVSNINLKENTIFIKNGKGGKDRVVVFGNTLKDKLALYLDGHKKNRFLFQSSRNKNYSTRGMQLLCQRYKKIAHIECHFTCHTFRHLFFTNLAHKGISKENRMIIAGHSSEKVQDIYTHLSINGIKDEIIAVLDRIS